MQKFMDAAKAETQAKREARIVPEDKYELIAFLPYFPSNVSNRSITGVSSGSKP